MPLFDTPVSPHLLWPSDAPAPRRRAVRLLARFAECFPDVKYDMDLGVELANAQAFIDSDGKHVRLYGGLVLHRKVGTAGLAVALAHETGHHLGGPPFLKSFRWLSSEERATEWAATVGLQKVFGAGRGAGVMRSGLRELKLAGIA